MAYMSQMALARDNEVPKMTLNKNENSQKRNMMELSCSFFCLKNMEYEINLHTFKKKQT